jgi:CheY-like chemotaxis protein
MPRVLIVEDEAPIAHAYQLVLEQAGYEVAVANEAASAIAMAHDQKPDLILTDILMPGSNGLDMIKQLDIEKTLPQTVVIALSNIDNQTVVDEAQKLGVAEYLRKVDYTPHQIVELVQKHLQA